MNLRQNILRSLIGICGLVAGSLPVSAGVSTSLSGWFGKKVCETNLVNEAEVMNQLRVGAYGVEDHAEVRAAGMLPRGAAVITSAGALETQGIRNIIHAASGSMTQSGKLFDPDLGGVVNSVKNSVLLAQAHGHRRIAIPFIGGKIFIDQIGIPAQDLVNAIVKAAIDTRKETEVRFMTFGAVDTTLFENAVKTYAKDQPLVAVAVVDGSITDFSKHGATVIVNAANMEAQFGGGLSGIIGRATGRENEIDSEAKRAIDAFYRELAP